MKIISHEMIGNKYTHSTLSNALHGKNHLNLQSSELCFLHLQVPKLITFKAMEIFIFTGLVRGKTNLLALGLIDQLSCPCNWYAL